MHMHMQTHLHARTRTHMQAHIHACTRTRAYTHAHTSSKHFMKNHLKGFLLLSSVLHLVTPANPSPPPLHSLLSGVPIALQGPGLNSMTVPLVLETWLN